MLELHVLSADDWQAWRAVRLAALRTAPEAFHSKHADWAGAPEARWRKRLSIAGAVDYVAYEVGDADGTGDGKHTKQAVAMATGLPGDAAAAHGTSYAEVISLWVDPAFRGRGVASTLIAALAGWAAERGFDQLRLCVLPGNTVARAVYERNSFVLSDEPAGEMSEDPNVLVMVRQLSIGDSA